MLGPDLKSLVNRMWDKFWSRGLTNPITSIEQISYLLFIKRLDENDKKKTIESKANKLSYTSIFDRTIEFNKEKVHCGDCAWSVFKELTPEDRLTHVRGKVFTFIKKLNEPDEPFSRYMENAVFLINTPTLLKEAMEDIDKMYEVIQEQQEKGQEFQDTLGDVYEYLLNELSQAGKNGQFRTPRHIIQMICEILEPDWTDKICDMACGTAGFLLGAYQHILTKYTSPKFLNEDENGFKRGSRANKLKDKTARKKLEENTFFGFDISTTMVRFGLMNLMLHGVAIPKIEQLDTLSEKYDEYEEDEQYSIIMANPPFTGKIDENAKSKKFRIAGKQSELLFIDRVIHMLKPGGRAAIIVPEGVLFGSSKAHKTIREVLLKDCDLQAVISLPSGVFKPYAGVKTSILFFSKVKLYSKTYNTSKVWFYKMENDGYTLDDSRKKLKENPLPKLVYNWKDKNKNNIDNDRNRKYFFVPIEELMEKDKGFDLTFNRYKKFVYEEQEYKAPKEICKRSVKYITIKATKN